MVKFAASRSRFKSSAESGTLLVNDRRLDCSAVGSTAATASTGSSTGSLTAGVPGDDVPVVAGATSTQMVCEPSSPWLSGACGTLAMIAAVLCAVGLGAAGLGAAGLVAAVLGLAAGVGELGVSPFFEFILAMSFCT